MQKQKKVLIITVLFVIALMGIVYAAYTALTLKINTTASASASIFSVGFDDVEPFVEKTNDNITVNATTPKEGDTTIDLSVSGLKNPGDFASVTYTIINDGDIDASNVKCWVGPAINGEGDWPENFTSMGSSWFSEDEVYEFSAGLGFANEGAEYWSTDDGEYPGTLMVGKKGEIVISVRLLKRVEEETTCSCTTKIVATPGSITIPEGEG